MSNDSFAEIINQNKLMVAGLKAHQATVAKRGIDEAAVAAMESAVAAIETLDNEQEALKAVLKTKTAELDAALASLKTSYSEARKTVKMAIEKTGWVEFGIADKQ